MSENLIADALHAFLAKPIQRGRKNRRFILLNGFDDATYRNFLARLVSDGSSLAGSSVTVRTTTPISQYEQYAIKEDGVAATWYRNHVQSNHILILILNSSTSELQSLQDIYLVNQTILATKGLQNLFSAIFKGYPLLSEDISILEKFLSRFRNAVAEPQLSNLVDFLKSIDDLLAHRQADSIQQAIALSLPYLELFLNTELVKKPQELTTVRLEPILKEMYRAARLGTEVLDKRRRDMFLDRLEKAELDDDSKFGNLNRAQKKDLLRHFLNETITQRSERIRIFHLDWREVKNVLSEKTHLKRADQLKALAKDIENTLIQQELILTELPEYIQDILRDMQNGKNASNEQMNRLVGEYQNLFGKRLSNSLRKLVKISTRNYSDFIVGVTTLAIELLGPMQGENQAEDLSLYITFLPEHLVKVEEKESEALAAFKILYGGVEKIISSVHWEVDALWSLAESESEPQSLLDLMGIEDQPEQRENEKEFNVQFRFRAIVRNANGEEVSPAIDFNWLYYSDSPAATTLANVNAEKKRFATPETSSSIPIYNTYVGTEDMRELDLHHPRYSLGPWYEKPTNLRSMLLEQLNKRVRGESLLRTEQSLKKLEQAWHNFVQVASMQGILDSNLDEVLEAYDQLLVVTSTDWLGSDVAMRGYRTLAQAWVVSPAKQLSRNPWAIIPLLHPLKLLWWRERSRHFNLFIVNLLNSSTQTPIVDEALFRRELPSLYGSAGFPAIIAQPVREGWPEYFLPVEELEGYELYHLSSSASEAHGTDVEREGELENEEIETQRAAETIANVIQDYIETYPFIRDGVEIVLLQCRDAALPELLVAHLMQLAERRNWSVSLSVIVHTEDRGAPLFRRVSNWLSTNEKWAERKEGAYFPSISLKVLECSDDELFQRIENNIRMDVVILADLLEEKGQKIDSDWSDEVPNDTAYIGYLPTYHAQQEPFEREESNRTILVNQPPYPPLIRHFYNMHYAAQKRSSSKANKLALFRKMFGLQDWEQVLTRLHEDFNWVICYDTTIDRYLLESTFPQTVQVIRYSLGLGIKRQHNLTVSSSNRAQDVVIRRLNARLGDILVELPEAYAFRLQVAERLVDEAKRVSGDIVLRAAGPGSYLNELIGLVIAKHLTEQRYLADHPGALTTWIYLDDFQHWFRGGEYPDLLFIAIPSESTEKLVLYIEVVETKCIGALSFDTEIRGAQRQTVRGVNRLALAWAPEGKHLDADYWYDQLYRAVVGNISVEPDQKQQWEAFRNHLISKEGIKGNFELDLSGHSWVFCHDSSSVISLGRMHDDGEFSIHALDAPESTLTFHHYGRAGLRQALLGLTQEWQIKAPFNMGQQENEEIKLGDEEETPMSEELSQNNHDVQSPTVMVQDKVLEPVSNKVLVNEFDQVWLQGKANNLERTLRQLSINVYPVDLSLADVGPSIVRFKLRLYPGESLVKLQRRANDLARELALTATPIIENVLGTNYVGIDLPRPKPETVLLLPLLDELKPAKSGELPIIIGQTPDGQTIIEDLAEFPHLLVAGATNSGKSVFLRSLILCLLAQYTPTHLQLLIVDPKRTDFSFFDGLPYLIKNKVITDKSEARDMLLELVHDEMQRRQEIMAGRSMRIKEFNQRFPKEALPPIVAIIDEYAQLVSVMSKQERDAFERDLMNLAAVARATGIHLVLATQRPSADVLTGTLKANLPASIAFKVASIVNSRIVIDQGGAENLLGRGDMLFKRPNGDLLRLQAPFVDEISIQSYLTNLKSKLR